MLGRAPHGGSRRLVGIESRLAPPRPRALASAVMGSRWLASLPVLLLAVAAFTGCGGDPEPGAGGRGGGATTTTSGSAVSGQGGGNAGPECAVDGDCKIVSGCCSCGAAPVDEDPAACEATADCEASHCTALGIPEDTEAACVGARCVMGFECDLALATCDAPVPECAEGETPRVVDGCTAECVPAEECRSVPE